MRVIVGAAIAALLMAGSAFAQDAAQTPAAPATPPPPAESMCAAVPPAPTGAPDGAVATRRQMEEFAATFTAWTTAAAPALNCRRDEAQAAAARARSLAGQYNEVFTAAQASQTAWQAEGTEYNARFPAPRSNNR